MQSVHRELRPQNVRCYFILVLRGGTSRGPSFFPVLRRRFSVPRCSNSNGPLALVVSGSVSFSGKRRPQAACTHYCLFIFLTENCLYGFDIYAPQFEQTCEPISFKDKANDQLDGNAVFPIQDIWFKRKSSIFTRPPSSFFSKKSRL